VGDRGVIAPPDSEDRDEVVISLTDHHGHRSATDRKDTIKVTIGQPRRVEATAPAS
jgi:hypothetical protein